MTKKGDPHLRRIPGSQSLSQGWQKDEAAVHRLCVCEDVSMAQEYLGLAVAVACCKDKCTAQTSVSCMFQDLHKEAVAEML